MAAKKVNKKKTTEAFKEIMFVREIVPSVKFIGAQMLWPYTWNGERRFPSKEVLRKITDALSERQQSPTTMNAKRSPKPTHKQ